MKIKGKNIYLKAIIMGGLLDVVGSSLWGFILCIYLMRVYNINTVNAFELMSNNINIGTINWVISSIFSIIGGYIVARIAKTDKLFNAIITGCLFFILGIFSAFNAPNAVELLKIIISVILSPLLYLAGWYLQTKLALRSIKIKNNNPKNISPKHMFGNLFNFSYKRSKKEAVGFYIAYLFFMLFSSFILGIILTKIMLLIGINLGYNEGVKIGGILAVIGIFLLTFLLLKSKNLVNAKYILILLLSGILTAFIGGILGLMVPAFITTRESRTVEK